MTDWNEEAKRLLPCRLDGNLRRHVLPCPCQFHPAVAAALAAAEARGLEIAMEIIRRQLFRGWDGSTIMLNNAIQAEIDKRKGTRENQR